MNRSRLVSLFLVTALLVMPSIITAQEAPEPLTWVGMVDVKPGAGPQFEKAFESYDKPLLDQLVADGKALSWGMGYELAGPGGYDYVMWVTMAGWTSMGEVEEAFDARYEALSEDELAAMIEVWMAAIEPGDDETQLLRHKVFKANPEGTYNYLRLSAFKVKPGHGGDFLNMYKSFSVPVQDQLLESGVITGYGMITQAIHSDNSFTHESWITFSRLADLEAYEKAFDEAYAEMSDGDGVARKAAWMKMMEPGDHFDRLIRVTKRSE